MTKNIIIGVLVATTLLFGYFAFVGHGISFGNVTGQIHYQEEQFYAGLKIGQSNASDLSWIKKGTCSLIASTYTVSASTTVAMDCAVTGVLSGDTVFGMFATSTPSATGPGWEVTGAAASTTSGYLTFSITNGTGASAIIPASLASSTRFLDLR